MMKRKILAEEPILNTAIRTDYERFHSLHIVHEYIRRKGLYVFVLFCIFLSAIRHALRLQSRINDRLPLETCHLPYRMPSSA